MLMEAGLDPEIIPSTGGFFRVSALTCPDLATAESEKESLSGKFPGSWIHRKK